MVLPADLHSGPQGQDACQDFQASLSLSMATRANSRADQVTDHGCTNQSATRTVIFFFILVEFMSVKCISNDGGGFNGGFFRFNPCICARRNGNDHAIPLN